MISLASAPDAPAQYPFEAQLLTYQQQLNDLISQQIPDREPKRHLYELVAGQLSNRGKGIRPALCLATCESFGGNAQQALPSAAAIELLHNAFLIHDDIEDESELRRGRPTLHQQVGIPLALNAGDALNALSVRVLRLNLASLGVPLSTSIFEEFDHMTLETIEGQAMELGWIRDNNCSITEDDYLLMVLKKTSWYSFIHPVRIGALIAGRPPEELSAFDRFGYFLGTAFQIQDDLLNLTGNQRRYGKEIGGDLMEGKRTLILAHLFKTLGPQEAGRLKAFLAKPRTQRLRREVDWIYDLLRERGSLEYARRAVRQFADGARSELEVAYAGASAGPGLDFIHSLVDYLVRREV